MPGSDQGYYNTGSARSVVTGDDQLAQQQGDFLMRQKLMQQNQAALQAQLLDSQANRDMQLKLQGTASDRYAHDDKFQQTDFAGKNILEQTHGANEVNYANAMNAPRNRELDYTKGIDDRNWNAGASGRAVADATNQSTLTGINFKNKVQGPLYDSILNDINQEARPASPAAGMPGSPLAGPPNPNAQPAQSGAAINPRMRERLLQSTLGLGNDPDQLFQRQIIEGMINNPDPAVRQAGLKMLNTQGINLPPEAISALSNNDTYGQTEAARNPQVSFALDQMALKAKRLTTELGNDPQAAADGVKELLSEAVTMMVQAHIPAEQAKTVALKKLNEVIPESGSTLGLILRDMLPPFGVVSNDTERGTMTRKAIGLP